MDFTTPFIKQISMSKSPLLWIPRCWKY